MRFVLASASPARRATLHAAGLPFDVVVSAVDEDAVGARVPGASVSHLVGVLAAAKADDVAGRTTGDALVLGCDSLLEIDGGARGKPGDPAAATRRWAELAGRTAPLHTGHSLRRVHGGRVTARADTVVTTPVRFGRPTAAEVDAYVATGEPDAVAGGFTVDGLGGWFVDGVEGDHHNVVGVSLPAVRRLLGEVGVTLIDLGWPAPC